MKHLFVFLFIGLTIGATWAQSETLLSTDTVTITSGRFLQGAQETGRNISVLYASDIEQLPANSLDEVLRYIPGVEVQSRNAFGAQSDIIIRGSTFSQVLMLIDGMRLNDPLTGHFNSNIPISPAEIDRIEVLKGPAAAMYGPDAVGGVIHIITKTAVAASGQDKTDIRAGVNAGEFGLFQANAGGFLQRGRLRIGGGLLWNQAEGQTLPTELKNDFDLLTVSVAAGLDLGNDWSILGRVGYDTRTFAAQYFYTRSTFDLSREQTSHWWNQFRLMKRTEKSETRLDVVYKANQDSFLFNPAFTANVHDTRRFDAQFNHIQTLSEQFQLNVGAQVDNRTVESNDRGDHNDWHGGVYAAAWLRPTEAFSLSASLRGDLDANYGFELLPQIQASYLLPGITLRASAGRSTRSGDYTERYVSNNLASLSPGRNLGNPDLEAERAWSLEAGLDVFPTKGMRLSGTVFTRSGTNLIDYVLTNEVNIPNNGNLTAGEDYFYTQNLDQVNTSGFEIEAWDSRKWGNDWQLRTGIGYTYLNSTNEGPIVSKYLANHAKHLFSSNIILRHQALSISVNGLWKQRDGDTAPPIESELTTSYTVWNGRVAYAFLNRQLTVNLMIHNVLNAQYADILGAKMPDRWFMGGIAWRLQQ